nr:unnamed protein product [Haemonchus contortus]
MICSVSSTDVYLENHHYAREIGLYHFEKGWKVAESFRDLSNFSAMEQSAEADQEMGSAPKSAMFTSRKFYGFSRQPFAEKWQGNRSYVDLDELMAHVKAWIVPKDQHSFAFGIRLSSQWEAVLDVDGG